MNGDPRQKTGRGPRRWIYPLLSFVCFVVFCRFAVFSDAPVFESARDVFLPGKRAEVSYHPTSRMYWVIGTLVVFVFFAIQTLRVWSGYFLHRKLFLYYLLGLIPFFTTILIIAYGVRAYFGLANTVNLEKTLEIAETELDGFVNSIEDKATILAEEGVKLGTERWEEIFTEGYRSELAGQKFLKEETLKISIYYLPEKRPNMNRMLIHLVEKDGTGLEMKNRVFGENSEEYESVIPCWLADREYTDIVNINGFLYLQHYSMSAFDDAGDLLVMASIPIERAFLNTVKEFQPVRIYITNADASVSYATDAPTGVWYWSLLLKPMGSRWELQALDWRSGYYNAYGDILFEIEPSEIIKTMTARGALTLFHREQKSLVMTFLITFTAILAIMQFLTIIFGLYLVSYITRSMTVFAEGHENVAQGNLDYRLPNLGRDQLGAMGRSFNSMVSNIESLLRRVLEQEKFKEELRIAREIQMSLLPDLDKLAWCENISASCIPAREVGGDYYEVVLAETGETGIFIADVSGKGTSAAFYMAELKGVLLALRPQWHDPHALLMSMNRILERALKSNVFISAAYLLLNPYTKCGKLARAGHCPAFHVKEDGRLMDLAPPGIAIGIAKNEVFGRILEVAEFAMDETDKVILYTDGLDEMTHKQEMYGVARLKEVLNQHAGRSVVALKTKILEDVLTFLASGEQNDDLTLVVAGLPSLVGGDDILETGAASPEAVGMS